MKSRKKRRNLAKRRPKNKRRKRRRIRNLKSRENNLIAVQKINKRTVIRILRIKAKNRRTRKKKR